MWRSGEELGLGRVVASAGELAGADRDHGLLGLVPGVARIVAGMEEGREPILLVGVKDVLIEVEPAASAPSGDQRGGGTDCREMLPGDAGDVEDRQGDRQEHGGSAEVRLKGDEPGRGRGRAQAAPRVALDVEPFPSHLLEGEGGERRTEKDLGQLGRLEAEQRQLDPALEAADRGTTGEDEGDGGYRRDVDADLELAQPR